MEVFGTIFPKTIIAYSGSTIAITCYSLTNPTWTKNGLPLNSSFTFMQLLILSNISVDDRGTYICEGVLDAYGKMFKNSTEVIVGGKTIYCYIKYSVFNDDHTVKTGVSIYTGYRCIYKKRV